jgi:hypothetical protein
MSDWRKNLWRWRMQDKELLQQAEQQRKAAERKAWLYGRLIESVRDLREQDNFAARLREVYNESEDQS